MHKGIIMIVKADSRDEALEETRNFLESYGDGDVWDWYAIGGRWNNTLAPSTKFKEWEKKSRKLLEEGKDEQEKKFISMADIDKHQNALQSYWKELGLKGKNPYCDHYSLEDDGNEYDVMPLSECLDTVKEWWFDYWEKHLELKADADRWLNEKKDKGMYGYMLKKAGEIAHQDFCFDCNIYNVENGDYSIPEDTVGYWAVMVDLHN